MVKVVSTIDKSCAVVDVISLFENFQWRKYLSVYYIFWGIVGMSTQPTANPVVLSAPVASTAPVLNTVILNISMKGSPLDFHMNGDMGCKWQVDPGIVPKIFPGISLAHQNASVANVTVLQSVNTFPIALGTNFFFGTKACGTKNEVTNAGTSFSHTLLPNSNSSQEHVIHMAAESDGDAKAWSENFPTFTSANLATEGVLSLGNCPYVFVNQNHPVVNLIRMNKEMLGVDIDTIPKMDGEWYKLSQELMSSCCTAIHDKILFKMATSNLFAFNAQAHPIDGSKWPDMDSADLMASFQPNHLNSEAEEQTRMAAHQRNTVERPGTVYMRVKVEYSVPNLDTPAAAA
jgi:hypothetical protein